MSDRNDAGLDIVMRHTNIQTAPIMSRPEDYQGEQFNREALTQILAAIRRIEAKLDELIRTTKDKN